MLDLNTGVALVVKRLPDGTFNYSICGFRHVQVIKSLWPFQIFFPTGATKISDYKVTPNQRFDFEAIYLFSVNIYHTSAVVKSIPYQFRFIMLKIRQNRTKPELIRILFVTSLDRVYSTTEDEPSSRSITNPWELKIDWEHLFRTFLKRFRWKNDLGRLQKKTKQNRKWDSAKSR